MRPAAPEEKMAEEKKEQSDKKERALLVAVQLPNRPDVTPLLRELGDLAETAGAEVVGEMVQPRDRIDPGAYLIPEPILEAESWRSCGNLCWRPVRTW